MARGTAGTEIAGDREIGQPEVVGVVPALLGPVSDAGLFVRLDETHFAYLHPNLRGDTADWLTTQFKAWWPGKTLICMTGDSFIDMTGQYRVEKIEP